MPKLTVKNVLGEEGEIFAGLIGNWDFDTKLFTKNCPQCSYCIGKEEAIRVIDVVNTNKRGCQWKPPPKERIMGICIWGASSKILVPRFPRLEGARKCQYFGKPRPKRFSY